MGIPLHEYKSNLCPYCNSEKTVKSPPEEPDLDFVIRKIKCMECKKAWGEIYKVYEIKEDHITNRRIEAMKTRKEKGWDKEESK